MYTTPRPQNCSLTFFERTPLASSEAQPVEALIRRVGISHSEKVPSPIKDVEKIFQLFRSTRLYSTKIFDHLFEPLKQKEPWAEHLLYQEFLIITPRSKPQFTLGLLNIVNKGRGTPAEDAVMELLYETSSSSPNYFLKTTAIEELARIVPFSNRSDKWADTILTRLCVLAACTEGVLRDFINEQLRMLIRSCNLTPDELRKVVKVAKLTPDELLKLKQAIIDIAHTYPANLYIAKI